MGGSALTGAIDLRQQLSLPRRRGSHRPARGRDASHSPLPHHYRPLHAARCACFHPTPHHPSFHHTQLLSLCLCLAFPLLYPHHCASFTPPLPFPFTLRYCQREICNFNLFR